jgi:hypothetical protein
MTKSQQDFEAELANIARWFSKDGEAVPVYYGQNGQALPCTRDEQDMWLAEAYGLARTYFERQQTQTVKWVAAIVGVSFLAGFLAPASIFPAFPQILVVGTYGAVIAMAIAMFKDQFIYRTRMKNLQARIERKLMWRDAVNAPAQRHNSFRTIIGIFVIVFFAYSIWNMMEKPENGSGNALLILIGVAVLTLLASFAPRLDRAHIRQTGKAFRSDRHSSIANKSLEPPLKNTTFVSMLAKWLT